MILAASAYPESIDAVLLASIQTSKSIDLDRHCDSAKKAASWVLPQHRSQSCGEPPPGRRGRGASAMAGLPFSAINRSGPVSGRVLNLSASGGT
jgi:hypothetical protein